VEAMFDYQKIVNALVDCDQNMVVEQINIALKEEISAQEILNKGLMAGMDIVGEKMQNGEMFIPEVLVAAQIMTVGLDILKPILGETGIKSQGSIVIGTVKGDLHDIGKNLVAMMLKTAGMQIYDLGVNVPPETFVLKIKEHQPQLLCLSALLTTTMPMMKATIQAVKESGLRDKIKIMVGGAPVSNEYAIQIGADGYAEDAGAAVKIAKSLI
jgi:5-methyltetrahydrofolate--homocysteine methyltransferase